MALGSNSLTSSAAEFYALVISGTEKKLYDNISNKGGFFKILKKHGKYNKAVQAGNNIKFNLAIGLGNTGGYGYNMQYNASPTRLASGEVKIGGVFSQVSLDAFGMMLGASASHNRNDQMLDVAKQEYTAAGFDLVRTLQKSVYEVAGSNNGVVYPFTTDGLPAFLKDDPSVNDRYANIDNSSEIAKTWRNKVVKLDAPLSADNILDGIIQGLHLADNTTDIILGKTAYSYLEQAVKSQITNSASAILWSQQDACFMIRGIPIEKDGAAPDNAIYLLNFDYIEFKYVDTAFKSWNTALKELSNPSQWNSGDVQTILEDEDLTGYGFGLLPEHLYTGLGFMPAQNTNQLDSRFGVLGNFICTRRDEQVVVVAPEDSGGGNGGNS